MTKLVSVDKVDSSFVSYQENEETTFESSDDFSATADDFEQEVRDRLNSSGDADAFQENMKALAKMVKKGQYTVKWVTCDSEDSRIDLYFSPNQVKCEVHKYVV